MRTLQISKVVTLALLLSTISALLAVAPAESASETLLDPTKQRGVRVQHVDMNGMVLEIDVPPLETKTVTTQGGAAYSSLFIPGYGLSRTQGAPSLPKQGFLLGIPPDVDVDVTVLDIQRVELETRRIIPVPTLRQVPFALDNVGNAPHELAYIKDPRIYTVDGFYPAETVSLGEPAYWRDQRVVSLQFCPVQYNPIAGRLCYVKYAKIRISFQHPNTGVPHLTPRPERPEIEALYKDALLNYASARRWRQPPHAVAPDNPRASSAAQAHDYRVRIAQDGLYRITGQMLVDVGLAASTDPRKVKLFSGEQQVAISFLGEDDGRLDPSDYILFYGEKHDTKYDDAGVYWLRVGEEQGLRMSQKSGAVSGVAPHPASFGRTVTIEKNKSYQSKLDGPEDMERWTWELMIAFGAPTSSRYVADLGPVAPISGTAHVDAHLYGVTSWGNAWPDHHAQLWINAHLVGESSWDGSGMHVISADFPQTFLKPGINEIEVVIPADLDGVMYEALQVDKFEIRYSMAYQAEGNTFWFGADSPGTQAFRIDGFDTDQISVFDISDATQPLIITDLFRDVPGSVRFEDTVKSSSRYIAVGEQIPEPEAITQDEPSNLVDPGNGADYIIIAPDVLASQALRLAQHRRNADDMRVMVVDVQDIYDEFNDGVLHPEAIKRFLEYAYANWTPPAPYYVVLFGDGHYDPKNHLGTSPVSHIPPYLKYVDPSLGETAADENYAMVSGNDLLPDISLGRFPVNGDAPFQGEAMLTKLGDYEATSPDEQWTKRLLFVSDNADTAGPFEALSDALIAEYANEPYVGDRVYVRDHPNEAAARDALLAAMDDGRLIVNYIGHGSMRFWADEKILQVSDIAALENPDRLPVMLPLTCADGYFIHPTVESLSESIVRASGRGAIASWGATGFGFFFSHDLMNRGFLDALVTRRVDKLGVATMAGKLALFEQSSPDMLFHLETYMLFGDPALQLPVEPKPVSRIWLMLLGNH